jgi:hypothetical protein
MVQRSTTWPKQRTAVLQARGTAGVAPSDAATNVLPPLLTRSPSLPHLDPLKLTPRANKRHRRLEKSIERAATLQYVSLVSWRAAVVAELAEQRLQHATLERQRFTELAVRRLRAERRAVDDVAAAKRMSETKCEAASVGDAPGARTTDALLAALDLGCVFDGAERWSAPRGLGDAIGATKRACAPAASGAASSRCAYMGIGSMLETYGMRSSGSSNSGGGSDDGAAGGASSSAAPTPTSSFLQQPSVGVQPQHLVRGAEFLTAPQSSTAFGCTPRRVRSRLAKMSAEPATADADGFGDGAEREGANEVATLMRAAWKRVVKNELEALAIFVFAMRLASVALRALNSTVKTRSPSQTRGRGGGGAGGGSSGDGSAAEERAVGSNADDGGEDIAQPPTVERTAVSSFMYRYILRESCSQFDSLPLTSLMISPFQAAHGSLRRRLHA